MRTSIFLVTIDSLGFQIKITSSSPMVVNYFVNTNFPSIFIPGYKVVKNNLTSRLKDAIYLKHIQSLQPPAISIKNNHHSVSVEIKDDWSKTVPTYVLTFLYSMLLRLYWKNDLFSLPASSVQGEKTNMLFLGKAGAGKTTTMLELVMKHNCKFISNNKTVLKNSKNGLNIIGGTQGITIRDTNKSNDFLKIASHKIDQIYKRTVIVPKHELVADLKLTRKTIFFALQINPGVNEFRKMDFDEGMILLYPSLLDKFDNENILFNWTLASPLSSPDDITKEKAVVMSRLMLENYGIYHLSGSLDYMCSCIKTTDI